MTAVPFWHQPFQARRSPAALFHAGNADPLGGYRRPATMQVQPVFLGAAVAAAAGLGVAGHSFILYTDTDATLEIGRNRAIAE